MRQTSIAVPTIDGPMTTFVTSPDGGGPFPAVVVFHDGPGLRPAVHDVASRLAAAGYCAVLPDLYHRSGELLSFDFGEMAAAGPASTELRRLRAAMDDCTADGLLADTVALLGALRDVADVRPDRKGCVASCHSARAALIALADLADEMTSAAVFHPSRCVTEGHDSVHLRVPEIRGSVYVAFGAEDDVSSLEENEPLIDRLRGLGPRATVDVIDGTGHGFTMPDLPAYRPSAAAHAWRQALDLFDRTLC